MILISHLHEKMVKITLMTDNGCVRKRNIFARKASLHLEGIVVEKLSSVVKEKKSSKCLSRCGVIVFILAFLIWVVFPLVFMHSYSLQCFFAFRNVEIPKNPQFDKPEKYDVPGIVNFYFDSIDTDGKSKFKIGIWMALPEKDINTTKIDKHGIETAQHLLHKTDMPVVLYLHGIMATRVMLVYDTPRSNFLVVSPDHRGYGDSEGIPTEDGIVNDSVQIYKWIRNHTQNDIYIWGHSLGTGITMHTVRKLKEDYNIVPKGVIIESAFTNFREELQEVWLTKVFMWLPYFKACILDPLYNNGIRFESDQNILYVDSPLLMMHSQDDPVIPVKLGRKLALIAIYQRIPIKQGNVTYLEFPGSLSYGHVGIVKDNRIPEILADFRHKCDDQNKRKD